jgi:hypothetical protein
VRDRSIKLAGCEASRRPRISEHDILSRQQVERTRLPSRTRQEKVIRKKSLGPAMLCVRVVRGSIMTVNKSLDPLSTRLPYSPRGKSEAGIPILNTKAIGIHRDARPQPHEPQPDRLSMPHPVFHRRTSPRKYSVRKSGLFTLREARSDPGRQSCQASRIRGVALQTLSPVTSSNQQTRSVGAG